MKPVRTLLTILLLVVPFACGLGLWIHGESLLDRAAQARDPLQHKRQQVASMPQESQWSFDLDSGEVEATGATRSTPAQIAARIELIGAEGDIAELESEGDLFRQLGGILLAVTVFMSGVRALQIYRNRRSPAHAESAAR